MKQETAWAHFVCVAWSGSRSSPAFAFETTYAATGTARPLACWRRSLRRSREREPFRSRVASRPVKVEFDRKANAAYIYLADVGPGEAVSQHVVDAPGARGMIVLDFDQTGRLIGIDVGGATSALPPEVLERAARI